MQLLSDLSGDIYAGGSLTGYFVVMVDKSDKTPKAVYARNYDGSGGLWFAAF